MSKIKSLIIYNSNIANKDKEDYNIADTISYYCNMANIHSYDYNIYFSSIDSTLKDLDTKEFDIIYIKDSLTINYLDFIGIELAYHIRFTQKFKYIPIVILSDLDGFTLSKLTAKAQILLTKNTFLNQAPKSFPMFDDTNYKAEFLDKITIERPKDTSGDHDIANQWAIYRWAEFLKVENSDVIKINKDKISSLLYFKYLLALNPTIDTYIETSEVDKIISQAPVRKGGLKIVKKVEKQLQKILYIDDEFAKGWEDIFKTFFEKKHKQKFQFSTIQEINKDTTYDELENYMIDYIKKDIPDLVILDIRLIKVDHVEQNEKNLSGIKLLKYIKEKINSGIQVILLTASGKSKILNEANKYDILGYIKKEHPHDTTINTKDTFDKLKELLDEGLENKYLKDIWNTQQEILKLDIFKYDNYNEIKLEILSIFEVLNSQMKNKFTYSMFAIFKVLESLVKFYIEEKREAGNRYAYWINTNDKIPCVNETNFLVETKSGNSNDRTENKIRVLLHEKFNIKDKTIHDYINSLVQIRNNTIHPKNKSSKIVDKEDINKWFKILEVILKNIKD